LLRPPERFRVVRDDFDRPPVPDPFRELAVVDRRDIVFFALPRERARALRCLATDFLFGRLLRGFFDIALELFMTLRTVRLAAGAIGRRFSAAFPATAPTTPPTTAPIGPAILPAAAPATAPTVCFGIGGISMFLDDCEFSSFFAFESLGIDCGAQYFVFESYYISDTEVDLAVTNLEPIGDLP
jgi:hypothetical protein